MKRAGIVLCGGRSSRMGRAKAWLPFGGEFMLQRVVRVLREAAGPVVVVAAPGQAVPPLPDGATVVLDEVEGRGPLGGLAAGLAALGGACDVVYLSACDVPFLKPEFVRRVVAGLEHPFTKREGEGPASVGRPSPLGARPRGGRDPLIAAPYVGGFFHPLAAAYRAAVLPVVRDMLGANRLRVTDLFDLVPTRAIPAEELRAADPELASLRNLNTPQEYAAALRHAAPGGPQEGT